MKEKGILYDLSWKYSIIDNSMCSDLMCFSHIGCVMKGNIVYCDLNWKYSIYPIKSSDIMKENYDKHLVIRNFDPCMVFTVNSTDGGLLTWYVYQSQM